MNFQIVSISMNYDFDLKVNRRNTNSLKWDVSENEIPMWVADMDFMTAPEIVTAIKKRAEHGVFGYTVVSDEWYKAIICWWQNRHNFKIEKDWLIFCTGTIPAISSIVRKITTVGENVVIITPVYNIFYNSILNNGRHVLESKLIYDGNDYSMDFDDLEKKLSDNQTSLLLLCNPQNPSGHLWDRETLFKIGELCDRYHVIVIADEIHCDITDPGYEYIPFASVSEKCRNNSITCISPTKAFNLAGLQTAAVIVPNENLLHKVNRGLNTDEVAEPSAFAIDAAVAAFEHGGNWLDSLREYLFISKKIVSEFIDKEIPKIKVLKSHATYLMWLDCTGICNDTEKLANFIREQTGLYLSSGKQYGGNGSNFIRMNIATSHDTLNDGLKRLKDGVNAYINSARIL